MIRWAFLLRGRAVARHALLSVLPILAACGRPVRPVSYPPVSVDSGGAPMTPLANGLRIARDFRVAAISNRRFTHADLWRAISPFTATSHFRTEVIGHSTLGTELRAVNFGNGPTRVLLWSQMHGDESTATMSLADIIRFLAESTSDPLRERLRSELTIVFVPMLNPDGAELFQRENAAGVDINRDARQLATPEGRALNSLRERLRPDFGFNLHDQGARTRAGPRGPQAAIALLAPPYNEEREYNDVRSRARLVAAVMAQALAREIPGRVAKYDESYSVRAFGDAMQRAGTSTVLIESGALPDDPQKQRLRALNVAIILTALDAIATRQYVTANAADYDSLPPNTGGAVDLLIAGGQLVLPGREARRADIAINYDDPVARTGGRVRDVGDLRETIAIDTIDASGLFIHADPAAMQGVSGGWLRMGSPAVFDLRRGADAASELVRRLGERPPAR
jgi:predicted deacylase